MNKGAIRSFLLGFLCLFSQVPASAADLPGTFIFSGPAGSIHATNQPADLDALTEAMERDLLSWMRARQTAAADKTRSAYQQFKADVKADLALSLNLGLQPLRPMTEMPWLKSAVVTKSPLIPAKNVRSSWSAIQTPAIGLALKDSLKIDYKAQMNAKAAEVLAALPGDTVIDTARMGPLVTAAAKVFFQKWMLKSAPFGIFRDGSFYAKILAERDGKIDSALLRYFDSLQAQNMTQAFEDLSDLSALASQVPCRDLAALQRTFDNGMVGLRTDLEGKGFLYRSVFNALLPVSVMLADHAVLCGAVPSMTHLTGVTGELINQLSQTAGFSLKQLIPVLDIQSWRPRIFTQAEIPNAVDFLNKAFLNLDPLLGNCSTQEKIIGGQANFGCARCGGDSGGKVDASLMDSGSAATNTGTVVGAEGGDSAISWGQSCSSPSGGGAAGAGIGTLGQCYGKSLRSLAGGTTDPQAGNLLACTLKAVGGGGAKFAMSNGLFPGSGFGCQNSLAGDMSREDISSRSMRYLDGRSDRAGRTLDRRVESAGEMRGFSAADGRWEYDRILSGIESGAIGVVHYQGEFQEGGAEVPDYMLSADGTVIYVDDSGMANLDSTLYEASLELAYDHATGEGGHGHMPGADDVFGTAGAESGDTRQEYERQGSGEMSRSSTEEIFGLKGKLCEGEGGACGSGSCNMVPAVLQQFTDCISGAGQAVLHSPDVCRYAKCPDDLDSDASLFGGSCTPAIRLTSNGCDLVNCATLLGDNMQLSRCCGGGGGAAGTSPGTGFSSPLLDPCRLAQGGRCGTEGGELITLPGTGDAPPVLPPGGGVDH